MRSLLLDEARALIDHGCYDEAGAFIGYLISMYFNAEYINANGWYDFRVDEITLPLSERILLLIAAESLKIKTVPNVVWLNAEYLFERLREASKMRLVAHFERFENFEF